MDARGRRGRGLHLGVAEQLADDGPAFANGHGARREAVAEVGEADRQVELPPLARDEQKRHPPVSQFPTACRAHDLPDKRTISLPHDSIVIPWADLGMFADKERAL